MDYIDKYVQPVDPEIAEAIRQEELRQNNKLELIASENFVSRAVMAAQGCVMTNKYAEGYPGKRYYGGCEYVDVAEELARQRAKELFGAEHANVQPHSGAQANMAVYFAALNPGDTVMGMNLSHGGHLTHGSPVNFSGKNYKFVEYGVDPQSETIDYTESDREKTGVDTEVAAALLVEKYELIKELLHGHDYGKFFTGSASERMSAIVETIDYIIGLREERKNDYLKLVSELSRAYSLCATTDIAEKLNLEVGFHKAVKSGIIKLIPENSRKKTAAEIEAQLNQLVSKSISSNEVIDVLDAVGLNKPNIAILSDEFLEEVRNMKQRNLAVELLNRLLKGKIKTFSKRNLVQSRKFSELLENAIRKYQNRTIETTQVILELIQLAKEINEAHKRGENTGLTEDELAFYDALAENESAKEVMGDNILKQIARDLTEAIRKNLSIDWSIRASVQAKMKMIIKRLLKRYGYPPDKTPKAVEIVMEQAKLMCQNESSGVRYQYQIEREDLPKVAEDSFGI